MNESEFELVEGSGNVFRDFGDPHADLKQARPLPAAWNHHPDRFVRGIPKPLPLPEAVWINPSVTSTTGVTAQLIAIADVAKSLTGSVKPTAVRARMRPGFHGDWPCPPPGSRLASCSIDVNLSRANRAG